MRVVLIACTTLALVGVWRTHDVAQDRDNAIRECSYRPASPLQAMSRCDPPSAVPWGIGTLVLGIGALALSGWTVRQQRR